jgi:hypothetical protein
LECQKYFSLSPNIYTRHENFMNENNLVVVRRSQPIRNITLRFALREDNVVSERNGERENKNILSCFSFFLPSDFPFQL